MPFSVWFLHGSMLPSGPPCQWWVGATTHLSRLAPPARWTGGWHRPRCLARALLCACFSSASSSPPASSSSPISWSSSRSNPQPKKSLILTHGIRTTTFWRWSWLRFACFNNQKCYVEMPCHFFTWFHLHPPGGDVDLRRVFNSLDPLCCGISGVSFWRSRFSAHPSLCCANFAGQVLCHVQSNHISSHWL